MKKYYCESDNYLREENKDFQLFSDKNVNLPEEKQYP